MVIVVVSESLADAVLLACTYHFKQPEASTSSNAVSAIFPRQLCCHDMQETKSVSSLHAQVGKTTSSQEYTPSVYLSLPSFIIII
ncbi:hypothetical protein INR49_013315 [Caranx melampygus]|nr:hypothetical protein INR49_013315 [Caranx melampygus]